jgi:hypothetical protein
MTERIFAWDWREQAPFKAIIEEVNAINSMDHRRAYLQEYETGQDTYVIVVSDHPVTDEDAERLWHS